MFNYLATFLQVDAMFLEYMFPFGRQHFVHDFHFSGFRDTSRLSTNDAGPRIESLGISGRQIELCFSLKGVEQSLDTDRPWSIRQYSIYHVHDVETGRTTWVTIKGNELVRDLIEPRRPSNLLTRTTGGTPASRALQNSLQTHLLLCNWSAQYWRSYISSLEGSMQNTTRRALSVTVDRKLRQADDEMPGATAFDATRRTSSESWYIRTLGRIIRQLQRLRTEQGKVSEIEIELPFAEPEKELEVPGVEEERFSFGDLQHVQFVEEKAADAVLALKSNAQVFVQMRAAYLSAVDSPSLACADRTACRTHVHRFAKLLGDLTADLSTQQARAESLMRLLADRKQLVRSTQDRKQRDELTDGAALWHTAVSEHGS